MSDDELTKLFHDGLSLDAIGRECGKTRYWVREQVKRLGLTRAKLANRTWASDGFLTRRGLAVSGKQARGGA